MSSPRRLQRCVAAAVVVAAVVAAMVGGVAPAQAGTVTLNVCSAYGDNNGAGAFVGQSTGNLTYSNECGQGRALQINTVTGRTITPGAWASWSTTSPPDITLTHAQTPAKAVLVDPNDDGYVFAFNWDGTGQLGYRISPQSNCCGGMDYGSGVNADLVGGHDFSWSVTCERASGCGNYQLLDVRGISLTGTDNTPPSVIATGSDNVFYTSGQWIRGAGWPATLSASAQDGICGTRIVIGGQVILGPQFPANHGSWQQCPSPVTQSYSLDTTQLPNGPESLTYSAGDAARPTNVASPTTTLHVDNTPVGLSLSGPTDVAATPANASAVIDAQASAGSSGAQIVCAVDGSQVVFDAASAQVPVSGLGAHQLRCVAQNHAVDAHGQVARSALQTFDVSIRQPTAEAVTFAQIADALRCRTVVKRVSVRGKPRVVRRHGKKVLVRGRKRTVRKRVRRCHARIVKRAAWVLLKRHGKPVRRHGKLVRVRRIKRVVLLPHPVLKAERRVGHGKATTVSGYLGLPDGTPLAGRAVTVIAAPDNGLGQFTPIATVTTNASGTWTAKVPPGPSRLIEAVYAGSATEEPAVSAAVKLTVPARIRLLKVTPRVPWGGSVRITGKLDGGYLPAGGAVVQLREGYGPRAHITFGVLQHVTGSGRFDTTFHFGPGPARLHVRYWFSALLVAHPDYPWAAASSQRRYVRVGGHPRITRHRHHKAHEITVNQ